ncbi:rod shape-determining protein MreC [Brevibacillus sp. SYP-B805]|uniref:rod shape-determining protein MreC n=1 Tax=Brevibacillus sp. SYP-B805 TaxID=1578199 RepID=UPI0013ED0164|nr:rod shape-determining protein MreC [Brevibacillus sp. SYP-B805]NGQ94309.1 rod shape-determining protein MreC [Brevibacillus sp. SYP-B805]
MSFFGNKRLIIVLVGLVLLITVMGYTSRERTSLTWPEMFVKDLFSVVQGIFYRPAQAFSDFIHDVQDAYNVYEENRALKASLDQYAQTAAELTMLRAENERLRDMLQAKSNLNKFQLRYAEVVARSSDHWNDVMTIDKGLKAGIKKDMAVITSKGLIGRIQSVSNFSSTVELLTNIERSNHISATILTEQTVNGKTTYLPVNGVVEEYDPQQQLLIMRKIPLGQKIGEKQQVITSGLGGVMPWGLPIGRVVRAQPDVLGLTQTVYIQPNADFSQISEVFVVERMVTVTPSGDLVPSQQAEVSGQPPATADSQPAANPAPAAGSGGGH